jgi:hypothetical protein
MGTVLIPVAAGADINVPGTSPKMPPEFELNWALLLAPPPHDANTRSAVTISTA